VVESVNARFRKTFRVRDPRPIDPSVATLTVPGETPITVTMKASKEELAAGVEGSPPPAEELLVIAETARPLKKERLAPGRSACKWAIADGYQLSDDPDRVRRVGDDGRTLVNPRAALRLGALPGTLKDLFADVESGLNAAAGATFDLLRWRFDIGGSVRPFLSRLGRDWEWALGGGDWLPGPFGVSLHAEVLSGYPLRLSVRYRFSSTPNSSSRSRTNSYAKRVNRSGPIPVVH